MKVLSRARRILSNLTWYIDAKKTPELIEKWEQDIVGGEAEELIGVYRVLGVDFQSSLLITESSLYICDSSKDLYKAIKYGDIELVKCTEDKQNADSLQLSTKDGELIEIPLRGSGEKFKDVYAFVRFFDRVKSDIEGAT